MDTTNNTFTVVGYSNNPPANALVMLRMSEPLRTCGMHYVTGNIPGEFCRPELVSQADIVVIQRDFPVYRDFHEIMARVRTEGKRVVLDLDDLLLDLPDDHPNLVTYGQPSVIFPIMQALVETDAVTVATPALADYYREFNQNVWVLPNYLNASLWPLEPKVHHSSSDASVVIGYMGTDSHIPDLILLRHVLGNLVQRYGNRVRFHFLGCPPPSEIVESVGEDRLTFTPFSLASYPEFIAAFSQMSWDICLAPLRDNLFNRCKSPIKFLEYSAMAIPGVYARLPPYEKTITHGKDGFLAQQPEEWEQYLCLLIESPELRRELGGSAHATLLNNWLLSQHAYKWCDAYRYIASSGFQPKKAPSAVRVAREATRVACEPHIQEASIRGLNKEIAQRDAAIQYLEAVLYAYRNGRIMRLVTGTQSRLDRIRRRSSGVWNRLRKH